MQLQPITKTSLLSIATMLISLGMMTINTDLIKGTVLILLGILILAVREYFKTIPKHGN